MNSLQKSLEALSNWLSGGRPQPAPGPSPEPPYFPDKEEYVQRIGDLRDTCEEQKIFLERLVKEHPELESKCMGAIVKLRTMLFLVDGL